MSSELTPKGSWKCYGGYQRRFSHQSAVLGCEMTFSVYEPPASSTHGSPPPVLYWLSGLTCTDENFSTKSNAQRSAAERGVFLVIPDTSPRGLNIPGDKDHWDFGEGAGFYVNATEEKWAKYYRMYEYVTSELPQLIHKYFRVSEQESIFGHSMGGHGALICALKNPGRYRSVSAFAPIANPINCPWGKKAFTGYLGADQSTWKAWDATELVRNYKGPAIDILIDQGLDDKFYKEGQLLPENFLKAALENGVQPDVRFHAGYDHSYYFISSFIDEHIAFHARHLYTHSSK